MSPLPIHHVLPELIQALSTVSQCILQADPGAGKSTIVPLHLLSNADLPGKIVMLEPRRLAAKNLAVYLARCSGTPLGQWIGYRIRGEQKVSASTRLEIVTEGVLIRQLQQDPELSGVSLVIFDEFHERSIQGDTALAFALESQALFRDDLKILVMSATLDGLPLQTLMPDAAIVRSEGRQYPITFFYQPVSRQQPLIPQWGRVVMQAVREQTGSILVFLPGSREIRAMQEYLISQLPASIVVYPLSGQLDFADQERAIAPAPEGARKIVLATNVAESSLTIEGIEVVVDSGLERRSYFDAKTQSTRLETRQIAKSSATQRAGRAGRLGPGYCYRLWEQEIQSRLEEQAPAEILRSDLSGLVLDAAAWGTAPEALRWLDLPPTTALTGARLLLQNMHALTDGDGLTVRGQQLARLPVEPRWGHLLLTAGEHPALAAASSALLTACALVAMHDLHLERQDEVSHLLTSSWRILAPTIQRWQALLPHAHGVVTRSSAEMMSDDTGLLLALAWPDRIARHQGKQRYQLANGQIVTLPMDHPLVGQEWLVVVELIQSVTGIQILLAERLDLLQIQSRTPELITQETYLGWDSQEERVRAETRSCLGHLILHRQPLSQLTSAQKSQCLLMGIRQHGVQVLPWDERSEQLLARVQCARLWLNDEAWPDWQEDMLLTQAEVWLLPALNGLTRLDQLKQLSLAQLLEQQLTWQQRQLLDQELPTTWQVPTGSQIKLTYQPGHPPVLSVRLQEMFGQQVTPMIAKGRIAVQIELLSPAMRPLQITQDLVAFWRGAYNDVKKEMRGRYPKHAWPDDPLAATPTRKTKKYS